MSENSREDGGFYIALPKSIPIGIIFAVLLQLGAVIWATSSFWKENRLFVERVEEHLVPIESYIEIMKETRFTKEDGAEVKEILDRLGERILYLEREFQKRQEERDLTYSVTPKQSKGAK